MKLKFLLILPALAVTAAATGQTPVAVGSASYASFPPAYKSKTDTHDGCRASNIESKQLWVDESVSRPLPTNDWWTDLLNSRYADALWSLPAMVHPSAGGVTVNYPKTWSDDGTELKWKSGLTAGAVDFSADAAVASDWGDWHIVMNLPGQTAAQSMLVTLVHGMPFTWVEYKGGLTPSLTFSATPEYFGQKPGMVGVAIGDDLYGVYFAPTASTRTRGDALVVDGARYVVVATLRSRDDLAVWSQYAVNVPRQTVVSWSYNEKTATLTTDWKITAENLAGGAPGDMLQGFLPHASKSALTKPALDDAAFQTPRGKMRLSTGSDFSFTYRFSGMLPYFAAPAETAATGANPYRRDRMKALMQAYADGGTFGGDTYWGGKGLTQMALNMMMAREEGETEIFEKSRAKLRAAFEDWLSYRPGEPNRFFAYYPRWRSLVGYDVSYDSDAFNDHHFHYGYFIYAGALLCMADTDFAAQYGDMLRLLAKDYANYDHSDERFPFLRTLDVWAGHSYAGGLGDSVNSNGNGQESSSEAMQSWGGVYLLGVALGDRELRDAGIFGWITESNATAEYWFDRDHIYDGRESNYDYTKYKHPYCTNLTSKGIGWWTWFSGDAVWMHSIQWMPVSPCLNYLSCDLTFAKWDYDQMMSATEYDWFETRGESDALSNQSLGNVVLCYLERSNPDEAARIFDQAYDDNRPMARGIDTGHISYYTIHSHRGLGDIDWEVYADTPTATAYRRADGSMSYAVYNSPDVVHERTVNFYRSGALEKSVRVPAGEGMTTFTADPVATSVRIVSSKGDIVAPGASTVLTATVLDQYGASMDGSVSLGIASGQAALSGNTLTVNAGASRGSKVIVNGRSAGLNATLAITVNDAPVAATVAISPLPEYVVMGNPVSFRAEIRDQYGNVMADAPVRFSENVVNGRFAADKAGRATVTAVSGQATATHSFVVAPSLPDLALGKTTTASSSTGGNTAEYATDGDASTRWESEHSDNQSIVVDLGHVCKVVSVDAAWEAAFASDYTVDFSDDGKSWTTVATDGASGAGTVVTPAAGDTRFVRLSCLKRGSAYGFSLYSLAVRGVDKNPVTSVYRDLAQGRPCTSSSDMGANTADNATDKNDNSRWESEHSDGQWLYVDLGKSYELDKIELLWEGAYAKRYSIDFSDDAETWRSAATETISGAGNKTTDVSGKARYVRISCLERGTVWGISFYTLKVWGDEPVDTSNARYLGIGIDCPDVIDEGESARLSASICDVDGNLSPAQNVEWSLTDTGGNIMADAVKDNVLTAPTYGTLTVGAASNGMSATKSLLVNETTKPVSLTVTPAANKVIAGRSVNVEVVARNQFDGIWALSPEDLDVRIHRNDEPVSSDLFDAASGRFTPDEPGTYRLTFACEPKLTATVYIDAVNLADANLALGCRAWASSSRGDDPSAVTDGLTTGKRWESEWKKDGEWIAVDLKHEFELTRVRLFWENAYATAFDIEVSTDGDNWTQAASVSDGKGGEEDVALAPGTHGRYIRMRETGRAMPEYGTSLYEMEVYGSRQLSTIIDAVVDVRASDGVAYDLRGYRVEPDAPGIVITASGKRLNR